MYSGREGRRKYINSCNTSVQCSQTHSVVWISLPTLFRATYIEAKLTATYAELGTAKTETTDNPKQQQSNHSQGARARGIVPRPGGHLSGEKQRSRQSIDHFIFQLDPRLIPRSPQVHFQLSLGSFPGYPQAHSQVIPRLIPSYP